MTEFSKLLRRARMQRRLSQSQLATIAGYDHSYVSRLEMDKRYPTRESILILAAALDLDDLEQDELLIAAGYVPESETMRGEIEKAMDALRYRRLRRREWSEVASD